jgi:NodT family efflux transporter outer membrane factor (OMF) lipoprotein
MKMMKSQRLARYMTVAGMVLFTLPGCTVGPDFQPPAPPDVDRYTASPLPKQTEATAVSGGATQHLDFTRKLSAQWWRMFGSEQLNALIKDGLAQNPSLAAATAAVTKARENLRAAGGALLYPNVDASLSASKQKTSGATSGGVSERFRLLGASVNVSYTLDIFGASRRQLEGLSAQVDYQRFLYEASYLTLTASLVTTAIQEASLAAQIATTKETVAAEEKQLSLTKKQFEFGAIAKESVLTQQTQLARTRATLPLLQKQLAATRHALAALTGRLPGEGGVPTFDLDSLHLPEELPVSLPSTLVRQRPDIRASEALLHQASAAVGVATADLYPQITLSASYGVESLSLDNLFINQNTFWNLGAGLLQPLFHGGELEAKRRAAVAAYNQAAAEYRTTVLFAFQNVADVLRALDSDAMALQAQAEADAAAKANLELTRQQFQLGAANYLSLLVAQQFYQQGRIGLILARAQRYADTAALFQALGGGWWNRLAVPAEDIPGNNSNN